MLYRIISSQVLDSKLRSISMRLRRISKIKATLLLEIELTNFNDSAHATAKDPDRTLVLKPRTKTYELNRDT